VLDRPVVWSRRNGPWRRVSTVWIGAAPGNAGGRGSGDLGAHGTRIPFGGDVAGANLEVLLGSIGLTRNDTFIVAAFNQLPAAGGGEPRTAEILAPVGDFPNSLQLLRETILACGPDLLIALGNIAIRATLAAIHASEKPRLPGQGSLTRSGLERHRLTRLEGDLEPDAGFRTEWTRLRDESPLPHLLWTTHPSAQNMSPYAGEETLFHARMIETRDAVRAAAAKVFGRRSIPRRRAELPESGIYALPEWKDRIAPRLSDMDRRWREKGV
jgi:uracil-DNA glycosylase